jgi:hypothetical protein
VCGIYQILDVGRIHPVRERAIRALEDTVNYIDKNMPDAIGFETQKEVTEFALKQVQVIGSYLEFGVFTGGTIRYMAPLVGNNIIHGFDSFQGLPEPWAGFQLGTSAFNVDGKLPKVPSNVKLYKGWFDDSLPKWLEVDPGRIAFIHVDCDLYSSTNTIFNLLSSRLQPGTIILFDEYFNYPNWRNHEYKAFQELILKDSIKYTYLAYARQQVVVRIDAIQLGGE